MKLSQTFRQNIIVTLLIVLFFPSFLFSQSHKVFGYIKAESSGELVLYANCVELMSKNFAVSNEKGFFSLNIPAGNIKLKISHSAYLADTIKFYLSKDTLINIKLKTRQLKEVKVIAKEIPDYEQTISGHVNISTLKIKTMPSLMGEPDIIKGLSFLPGVTGGNKGFSNMYVRGGGRSENLLILDGAPFYGSQHAWGFISIFNTDIIKSIDLYKGGFPARYGGRTSSVLDIAARQGNNKKFKGKFDIGTLYSKFLLEGPIIKDKTSFLVALRSSYIDLLMTPFRYLYYRRGFGSYMGYKLIDLNAKINHNFNRKNKIYLNFYSGYDIQSIYDKLNDSNSGYVDEIAFRQENISATLGYQSIISPKLFFNSSLVYSKYLNSYSSENINIDNTDSISRNESSSSKIDDISYNFHFDYFPNNKHRIKTGAKYNFYRLLPGIFEYDYADNQGAFDTVFGTSVDLYANELAVFVEDEIHFSKKVSLNAGLRFNLFHNEKTYKSIDPRFSFRWQIKSKMAIKTGFSVMHQFLHAITNNTQGINGEIWVTSNENIAPIEAYQASLGLFGNYGPFDIDYSVETYYKKTNNLIYFKYSEPYQLFENQWEDAVYKNGEGESYGLEVLLKKTTHKWQTSLAYTLAWTYRRFSELNNGNKFPFLYDKRHDINLSVQYYANNKNTFGVNFTFNTGTPVTLPEAYVQRNRFFYGYYVHNGINNMRLPAYHRLDFSYKRMWKTLKGRDWYWSANIYNVYARQNPVYIYYDKDKVKQVALNSVIPTLRFGMKF